MEDGSPETSVDHKRRRNDDDNSSEPNKKSDWICEKCQHNNFHFREACQRCHNPKPGSTAVPSEGTKGGDWICPNCSNRNFGFRLECNRRSCLTPRPGQGNSGGQATDVKKEWDCPACGNKNFPFRDVCNRRACGQARPKPLLPGYKEGDWQCPVCGNHNYAHRSVCNKLNCNVPRPDLAAQADMAHAGMAQAAAFGNLLNQAMGPGALSGLAGLERGFGGLESLHALSTGMMMSNPMLAMGGLGFGGGTAAALGAIANASLLGEAERAAIVERTAIADRSTALAAGSGYPSNLVPRPKEDTSEMTSVKLYQDRLLNWVTENKPRAMKDWAALKRIEEDIAAAIDTAVKMSYPDILREKLAGVHDAAKIHLAGAPSAGSAQMPSQNTNPYSGMSSAKNGEGAYQYATSVNSLARPPAGLGASAYNGVSSGSSAGPVPNATTNSGPNPMLKGTGNTPPTTQYGNAPASQYGNPPPYQMQYGQRF